MSKNKGPDSLDLPLDLPLHANDERDDELDDSADGALWLEETSGDDEELEGAGDLPMGRGGDEEPAEAGLDPEAGHDVPAPFRDRVLSGLLDLGIHLLVLGATVASVHAMGIVLSLDAAVPLALLGLIFSFLYWFIPLAFWGQTPGMAWVGNSATSLADEPLTFGQSVLRWLGALLTLALAGLPLLLALTGRSATDRLSDSKTVVL